MNSEVIKYYNLEDEFWYDLALSIDYEHYFKDVVPIQPDKMFRLNDVIRGAIY